MIFSLLLSFSGLYLQDCARGFQRAQEFQGERVIYREENFFDLGCQNPSVVTRSYGSFALGKFVLEPLGAQEMDFRFERVTLEPKTEAVAKLYRERKLCGLAEWEAKKETEITGRGCDFLDNGSPFSVPAVGEMRFGIVARGEGGLYFGRLSPDFPGKSPATRPRSLDPLPYLLRTN